MTTVDGEPAADEEYAAVREALASYRGRRDVQREATSFLLPTETDWVDADTGAAQRPVVVRYPRPRSADGGYTTHPERQLGDGRELVVELRPGVYAGDPTMHPEQTLTAVRLMRAGRPAGPFRHLGPVLCSELVRDLEPLVAR